MPITTSHSQCRAVEPRCQQGLAVGAEGHGVNRALMLQGKSRPLLVATCRTALSRRRFRVPGADHASGLTKATATTVSLCGRGSPNCRPVAVSHSRAVCCLLPVNAVLLSRLKATALWWSRCSRGSSCFMCVVASHSRAVLCLACRQHGLAVAAEGHGLDPNLDAGTAAQLPCPWPRGGSAHVLSELPVSTVPCIQSEGHGKNQVLIPQR